MQKEELIQKVRKFIEENRLVEPGDRVLASVSGGPDSVFMLFALVRLRDVLGIRELGVLHINHMLRDTAERDEEFVARLAEELSLDFMVERIDVAGFSKERGMSVEEAGKFLREKVYEGCKGWDRIALGHTMDDNLETFLIRLFRGSGIRGLLGIPVKRGRIIRPIMCLKKSEILEFLRENGIDFKVDETNLSPEFLRNRVRMELIPKAGEIFGSPYPALKVIEELREFWEWAEGEASRFNRTFLFTIPRGISFYPIPRLREIPKPVKLALFSALSKRSFSKGVRRGAFLQFLEIIEKGRGSMEVDGKILSADRDLLFILEEPREVEYRVEWGERSAPWSYPFGKEEREHVRIRRFREGDRVYVPGLGRKKVKKIMQEKGVPRVLRKELPVVTLKGEIVWIPPVFSRKREVKEPIYLNITPPSSLRLALKLL